MDIERHILDAVSTGSDSGSQRHLETASTVSQQKSPLTSHFTPSHHNANSSAEDVSTTSDSGNERDYQTDFTTPESSESCAEDMQPDDVEDFRDREYPQLKGKTYLDHGGTTLYAKSLIDDFAADMVSNLYGNPHSASTPSAIAGHRVDTIRERALRFFNADPEEFDLVFVANATAAIKLVIDCFKDHAAASNTPVWYGYHRDSHTSLVGVRESTKMHRCFTSDEEVDIWINSGGLGGPRARQLGLFAYPGQSNMTGRRLPLSWPGRIRKSFHKAVTYTLLDAAALASTAPLDLADPATAPDFVALSFYKIFGFPNIGALIVRKDSAHVLENRKFFGGGTVEMVIAVNDTWHAKKDTSIHDRLEDGTLPFHSIFALDHAMNVHERLYGPNPMKFISHHTAQLGRRLYDGLSQMKHANGLPVCRIYKDDNAVYGDPSVQGSTVAFNVQHADGSLVGFEDVEEAADERNIYIRSGSLCNPGGVATYLNWTPAEMKAAFAAGHRCTNPTQVMLGKPTGVVRVSLGAMSTASDVNILLRFVEEVYVSTRADERINTTVGGSLTGFDPASSGGACQPGQLPVLSIPQNLGSSTTPSTAASSAGSDKAWEAAGASLPQTYSTDRQRAPPFIPADYVKLRKPWEEEMRKQTPNYAAMEIKVRELEDASTFLRNPTPSVKARKFGRSVVNLLRTKSHAQEVRNEPLHPR
ncbi:Putative aminotransferase class V domain, pyridoxal phosphate-dependent transferase, major [Septoria linicola]|uniref:Aminotransferase class V domain, pyridoxal phosphate-dependent transferase, major n=1 Tax=Septoria linicola TaxID=215465 RepID=A0A9Q9AKM0_9PEZI|nr:Putative aminotransferase class V domain, pyridoxal phosphate-dependent transferase, major [Septoria linicola]